MHPRASVVRSTLSVVLAVSLAAAGAASATTKKKPRKPAPKPVCHLVGAGTSSPTDDSLKITSADIATNATMLTVVIRVAKLATGADPGAPTGRQWELDFTADNRQMSLGVFDGPAGTASTYGIGTATLDTAKNEIRYSVKLADLASKTSTPMVKNGSTSFANFTAFSALVVQAPSQARAAGFGAYIWPISRADSAQSTKKYTAGYPSCVTVGS